MPTQLIQRLHAIHPLTAEEIQFLRTHIPVREFGKGEVLLRQGEISNAFFFVEQGCVRLYYEVGETEKTAYFYTENDFVSAYESYTKQVPSKFFLEAIEPSLVAVISQEVAGKILQTFPKFAFLARMMMEEELIACQQMISTFITLNPEERYQQFVKDHFDLSQRIPQYYLATYLGVAPETLSRIRKRLANR